MAGELVVHEASNWQNEAQNKDVFNIKIIVQERFYAS
jgi:hypothetical protein